MGLFDSKLFAWLQPRPPTPQRQPHRISARALAGGRLSTDTSSELTAFGFSIESPPDNEHFWRINELDTKTLSYVSPARLLELMVDLSPELSAGIWNLLRLLNPGWKATASRPGSDDNEPDTRAQAALDDFLKRLTFLYTADQEVAADTVINALLFGGVLRGGLFAELVLDENGRYPLNIATPDPYSIRFKKMRDPLLGTVYQPGQWQRGVFVPFDRETVKYTPIDPLPGKPFGRSPISPALHTSLFIIGVLHDLRRVIMQQGWPRIDLEIDLAALAEAVPDIAADRKEWEAWVNDIVSEVETVYAALEPDDAYVHSNVVKVNQPVGTMGIGGGGLQVITTILTKLERMAARGLKMMPLLLGIDDATSDANANRQWEIQAASVKSLQHLAEQMLEKLLTLALECQGILATVSFRFAELRAAEMMRDAQTESMLISNEKAKYEAGWISQDEAAQAITGHPADLPEPRISSSPGTQIIEPDLSATGENRLIQEVIREARRTVETAVSSNGHHKEKI